MQTDATLLDVTCCIRLHTLLHVVGSCCAKFETGQTLSCVKTDATTPNIVGSCCVCLQVALVNFLRFFICCISCLICKKNTKREYFSRCALSDFEGLVLIIHDLYRIPQRTRMTLSNSCAAALCFCDFSIFQEEPLKDFGYNWFLLNRFVFMGLSCSLDLTILENFRNKKQIWSHLWKRNQPSLTLK